MSHAWAYAFYHSRSWRECREAYGTSEHWLCEDCHGPGNTVHHHKVWLTPSNIDDPDITLGWWNLRLVCKDCHAKAHRPRGATREGFAFDEDGNLVPSDLRSDTESRIGS